MKKLFSFCLLFFLIHSSSLLAQQLSYGFGFGGAGTDQVQSLGRDTNGNIIITGLQDGSIDIGSFSLSPSPNAGTSAFLISIANDATVNWGFSLGDTLSQNTVDGDALVLDNANNIILAGTMDGTVDFDPSLAQLNLNSGGDADMYLAKYSSAGILLWAHVFPVIGTQTEIYDIAVDALDNIFIVGRFQGSLDFDPGPGVNDLTSAGGTDIFLAKYDPSGNFIFARRFGGGDTDEGRGVVVNSLGNPTITGFFETNIEFDPGGEPDPVFVAEVGGSRDAFVAQYDTLGNFLWVQHIPDSARILGNGIAIDPNDNVYITGGMDDVAFFPGDTLRTADGLPDAYVAKYSDDSTFLWARQFPGDSNGFGWDISVNNSSNVFFTSGFLGDSLVADEDFGLTLFNNDPGSNTLDISLIQLDEDGNFLDGFVVGGVGSDNFNADVITGNGFEFALSGGFVGANVPLDPESSGTQISSNGGTDGYVANYQGLPVLLADNDLQTFASVLGLPSGDQSYLFRAGNLQGDVMLSTTGNFEVSIDAGLSYSTSVTIPQNQGGVKDLFVWVRMTADAETGINNGSLVHTSTAASNLEISLRGVVGAVELTRGQALTLDGMNDFLEVENTSFNFTSDLSIRAWVLPNASGTQGVFTWYDSSLGAASQFAALYIGADNKLYWTEKEDGFTSISLASNRPLIIGEWSHVAISRNASEVRLYVNGVLEATSAFNQFGDPFFTDNIHIGLWTDEFETENYFNGQIDELVLTNFELTQAEIKQSMHIIAINEIVQWQFNQSEVFPEGTETYDFLLGNVATFFGNPSLSPSTANIGNDSALITEAETQNIVAGNSVLNFFFARIEMEFTSHSQVEDFTITHQFYPPNDTLSGIAVGDQVFSFPTWTINKSDSLATFMANPTFKIDLSSFSKSNSSYILYYRPLTSAGAWTTLIAGASAVTDTSLTFNGIDQIGQYMIAFRAPTGTVSLSTNSLTGFVTSNDFSSGLQSYSLIASPDLNSDLQIIAPEGFEIASAADSEVIYQDTLTFSQFALAEIEPILYVRLKPDLDVNTYDGFIHHEIGGIRLDSIQVQGAVITIPTDPNGVQISRGLAASFDGNSCVGATLVIPRPDEFTVEVWLRPLASESRQQILAWTAIEGMDGLFNTAELYIDTDQTIKYAETQVGPFIEQIVDSGTDIIENNEWFHVALVRTSAASNNVQLFVNGVNVSTASANLAMDSDYMTIGGYRWFDDFKLPYSGEMDELRIWNVARNEQQIQENMFLTLPATAAAEGLASYWQFNESGSFVDYIGGGLGTVQGQVSFVPSDVNVGRPGASQSLSLLGSETEVSLPVARVALAFLPGTTPAETSITFTFQGFNPNATIFANSETDEILLDTLSWTLNSDDPSLSILGDITFILDPNLISTTDTSAYNLYFRSLTATGTWEKVADAITVTDTSITFSGTFPIGQYTISVIPREVVLTANPTTLSGFVTRETQASPSQSYLLTGSNLPGQVLVQAPNAYEVSLDDINFGATQTVSSVAGSLVDTIYVRLKSALALGTYDENISHLANGTNILTLPLSGRVVNIGPTNFSVTVTSNNVIRLSWSDENPNILINYLIERKAGPQGSFNALTSTTATFYEDTDNTLQDTITYFYRVQAQTSLGLSAYTEELGVGFITSLEGNWLLESSKLGPNPALDEILLEMNNAYLGEIKARLMDLQGVIRREDKLEKKHNNLKYSVDLKDLESGVYLLWIDTKKGRAGWRFIKQ